MKSVMIIGTGVGPESLTQEGLQAIAQAQVLLGAERMLKPYADRVCHTAYMPEEVADYIANSGEECFAVLVSGDVGFYSAATKLNAALSDLDVRFVPGISSLSAFFARLKRPWQEAAFISLHGRSGRLIDTVRRNRLTFCLAGGQIDFPPGVKVTVGENLGQQDERIYETDHVENLSPLSVLLIENESFDASVPTGLPDTLFKRLEGVPMTKSEIRSIAMSKLRLQPHFVCWDIGAGTGSVTVELALGAYRGQVYAIERRLDAVPLIEENCAAFRVGNVTASGGEAPEALETLPAPDAVFVGGSGGKLNEIIGMVLNKNPKARIVITAISIETASAALAAFNKAGLEPELIQINAARGKRAGGLHMMLAQNPVTIISAGGPR